MKGSFAITAMIILLILILLVLLVGFKFIRISLG